MNCRRYTVILFLALSVVYMMVFIQSIVMTVAANDIMRDMNLTPASLGFLGSSYSYAYVPVMLFSGLIAAHYGPRLTLGVGFAVSGMGGLLFACSTSYALALVGRCLVGMGLATTMTSAFTLFSRWYRPESFSRLTAVFFTIGGMGAYVAAAILPPLNSAWGWRGMFLFLAVVTLGYSLLNFLVVRDQPPVGFNPAVTERESELSIRDLCANFRTVAKSLDFWRIAVWFGTVVGSYLAFIGLWAMPYLKDVYGFSHTKAGHITSMAAFGFIIFTPIIAWVCESVVKSHRICLGLLGLMETALFSVVVWRIDRFSDIELYIVMFVVGVVLYAPGAIGYGASRALFGARMTGMTGGVFGASVFLGGALLQVLCGWLLEYALEREWTNGQAYALAFVPIAVCGVAAAIAGFTLSQKSHPIAMTKP